MEQENVKKEILPFELLFVLYFWGFTLLKTILQMYSSISTVILLTYTLIIVSISIFKILRQNVVMRKSYLLINIVLILLLFDSIVRPNKLVWQYVYEFIIYGALPIHLLSLTNNPKYLLRLFSIFSAIIFLLYCLDPINHYAIFGDYMTFGFNLALPAYFGLYIGRKYFNYKWMLPIEMICLLEIIIFANQSVFLSVLIFWILIELFYTKKNLKEFLMVFLYIVIAIMFLINIEDLLNLTLLKINDYGYYSYSLKKIQMYFLSDNFVGLFSGRLIIWNLAKEMISDNFLIGLGTAAFEAKYLSYTHNLFFDLMTSYGVLGLVTFTLLLIKSIRKILKQKQFTRLLGLLFFCLWCPKLFFSTYLFKEIGIWCFLAYSMINFPKTHTIKSRTGHKILAETIIKI